MSSFRSTALLFLCSLLLTLGCNGQKTGAAYVAEVEEHRQEKNVKFKKNKEETPLDKKARKKFKSLDYYAVNESYRVQATFKRTPNAKPFKMKTTTDRQPDYVQYGNLNLRVNDRTFTLPVYQNLALTNKPGFEDYLFIPFTDLTNGEDTYGGGRYLDFKIPEGDQVTVDFNLAYNPYCAYNAKYSCPIPPANAFLKTRIEAGEKYVSDGN
ncbi:MAG: DUF1684 domain-containing protein [Bacteroidota bacterium]